MRRFLTAALILIPAMQSYAGDDAGAYTVKRQVVLPYGMSRYYIGSDEKNPESVIAKKIPLYRRAGENEALTESEKKFVLNFRGVPFYRVIEFLGKEFNLKYVFEDPSPADGTETTVVKNSAGTKVPAGAGGLPVYKTIVQGSQGINLTGFSAPVFLSTSADSLDEAVRLVCRAADYYCRKVGDTWKIRKYEVATFDLPSLFITQVTGGLGNSQDKVGYRYDYRNLLKQIRALLSPEGVLVYSDSGFLTVQDRPGNVEKVREFIEKEADQSRAVKLDVKVVRVDLNKEYQSGIDWNALFRMGTNLISFGTSYASTISGNAVSFGIDRNNVKALLKFLENFGKVKVVKEWSTTAISGKPIFTNNVEEVPWFSQTVVQNAQTAETTTETHFKTVGLQIKILPEIYGNHVKGSIYAEISSLLGFVEAADGTKAPHTAVSNAFVNFDVPVGKAIVISGLKEKKYDKTNSGVPVLKDIPLVGNLFGSQNRRCDVSEIVIIVTPEKIASP